MTQEEKQLLLTDICARLPYGLKICVGGYICMLLDIDTEMGDKLNGETFHTVGFNKPDGKYNFCAMTEVKPYLRPMSSMTPEEKYTYRHMLGATLNSEGESIMFVYVEDFPTVIDWLNANYFDYRGLIEKGLALEAPEGMYKTKSL